MRRRGRSQHGRIPRSALVLTPPHPAPYEQSDLDLARQWLDRLASLGVINLGLASERVPEGDDTTLFHSDTDEFA